MKMNFHLRGIAVSAIFTFATLLSSASRAQSTNTEEVLRRVADRIINTTSFEFVNAKTGQKYKSTKDLPPTADIHAESRYNRWEYVNGVITTGMMQTAEALNDKKYADYSVHNYSFIFDNAPFFEEQYKAKTPHSEYLSLFRMDRLDDVGAMAAGLCEVDAIAHRADFKTYIDKAANYISKQQLRLPDSTLSRPEPRYMTLWADDMYMSIPFLARMGKLTGNNSYFDDCIKQIENFNHYLYDPNTGLYFHTYYSAINMNGVAHWGRCNGWVALATVQLLNYLPANHPKRQELIGFLLRQIVGYSRYQDQSGLWHQLLDKPDSYLETSATAMFTYAIARAVNQGWIDKNYINIARQGWKGLLTKITPDGQMADVCIGTGIEDDIKFYYSRPTQLNDSHGLGAFLLVACEMLRAEKNNYGPLLAK